jgi:hypothetical protein
MNISNIINFKLTGPLLLKYIRQTQVDILIVLGLAIAISISTYIDTYQIPEPIFTDFYAQDVWFGSDIPTVLGNITSLDSDFGRNNKHPLFPLLLFPLVFGVGKLFHLDLLSSARLVTVGISILWVSALYILLRVMSCHRLDATLFSILGGVSAAAIFWLVIPESFASGSFTILLGLIFIVLTQSHQFAVIWYVLVNVLTVSITITNSMVGLLATVINNRWRKTILIALSSLLLATGLWGLQRIIFTNSGFPFQPGTFIGEKKFVSAPGSKEILAVLSSFFYQTLIMPAVQWVDSPIRPNWVKFETDHLSPTSGGLWGTIAVFAWTGLLGLGLWGFFSIKQHRKLRIILGLTLSAQLLMHSIYGVEETFIYSLHFAPLLLTFSALSLFTRFRLISLLLVTILIFSAGINNKAQFSRLAGALWNYGTPQQRVVAQMKLRPSDSWPRSSGHVILAQPGSTPENKAFHEPGGSFSPQPGSFGVSIWAVDTQGKIKDTSDSILLNEIQQQLISPSAQKIPTISDKTPYYKSSWSSPKIGSWQLDLKPLAKENTPLLVVVRSVGPAGGAISALDWNGQRLLIGDRWVIKNISNSARVYLGSESNAGWIQEKLSASHWEDKNGWAYARIEVLPGENLSLQIEDSQSIADSGLQFTDIKPNLTVELPDAQFVNSLQAQVLHIMMGLVGTRTRPSDPINYPLPRFRDGAYQMVALAHAGQISVARQLSTYFAENDFVNSIFPEADIPALGIWALEEVASALNQPDYDQWLWPHIRRKAELIGEMLSSNRPGYPVSTGTKFPFSENPDFMRAELTAGRMDNTPNAISLDPVANVMSYRALKDAATLADRMKKTSEAKRWRSQAEQLQMQWLKTHQTRDSELTNELWPSWIAASDTASANPTPQNLRKFSQDKTLPIPPPSPVMSSNVIQAHQWLLLDRIEPLWSRIEWLWANQASPGLFTWGDLNSPEVLPKSFSQWYRFRGWINPTHITPDYRTAAEMLLLQLDMLSYLDQSQKSPTLVIGAGIPKAWLSKPMKVKGQLIKGNSIDWSWDGTQMKVKVYGQSMNVKLGSNFPVKTIISIETITKKSKE